MSGAYIARARASEPLGRPLASADMVPAGLPVVAGVKVHHWPLPKRAENSRGVQGGAQQPAVAAIRRGSQHASGMPPASVAAPDLARPAKAVGGEWWRGRLRAGAARSLVTADESCYPMRTSALVGREREEWPT
jgi:hypothetical protein